MSSNTKQILAITLGSLGLILGIVATITAYNAKNTANEDENVSALVQGQFATAQARQDALEKKQASDADKLIAGLTNREKSLIKRINSNSKGVRQLRKRSKNQQQQINSLSNRNRGLQNEISSAEKTSQNNFNTLSKRINRTNQDVNDLQQQVNKLRNRVSNLEDFGN